MIGTRPFLSGSRTLDPLARVRRGLLAGAFRYPDHLQSDAQAHVIHHREHGGETFVLAANEVTLRTAVIAERKHAGRAGVDPELVLDGHRADIVELSGRAILSEAVLRHDE